jgi:hypothetical protein
MTKQEFKQKANQIIDDVSAKIKSIFKYFFLKLWDPIARIFKLHKFIPYT